MGKDAVIRGPDIVLSASALIAALCLVTGLDNRKRAAASPIVAAAAEIVPSPPGSLDAILARGLFGPTGAGAPSDQPEQADAQDEDGNDAPPQLAGIVGRLPDRIVVLVRRKSGGTRLLGIGETIGGWRLTSVARDAALFVRGDRQVRVEVMAGSPDGSDQ